MTEAVPRIWSLYESRRWMDRQLRRNGEPPGHGPIGIDRGLAVDATSISDRLREQGRRSESREWLHAAALAGLPEAGAAFGALLIDENDLRGGERWLVRAAEAGSAAGMFHLGRFLLFSGQQEQAAAWLTRALEGDPYWGVELVRDLRWRGQEVLADEWMLRAAESGNATLAADASDAAARRGDRAEAERWMSYADHAGDAKALMYGAALAGQRGDDDAYHRWLELAAKHGDKDAVVAVGSHLLGQERIEEGKTLLEQAAAAGDTRPLDLLARVAWVDGDEDAQRRLCEQLAAAEAFDAVGELARSFLEIGDPAAALRAYAVAADHGHLPARVEAARLCLKSEPDAAVRWLEPAAAAGVPDAGLLLGMAEQQRGRDDAARRAFRAASDAGDNRASHKLGVIAHNAGDLEAATAWYMRAAKAGEAASMWNLGQLANERDPDDALRWLTMAATHGHPKAATRMGMWEAQHGRLDEALRWLEQAQALGDGEATTVIDAIRQRAEPARRPWHRRGRRHHD
jgi:TPR repeat protein